MAFEWTTTLEDKLFEDWWNSTYVIDVRNQQQAFGNSIKSKQQDIENSIYFNTSPQVKNEARTGGGKGGPTWSNYLNSYLQTQVQEAQKQAEIERVAQQELISKAEQDYAAASKQAETSQLQAKKISAVADYQGQQIIEQARKASALALQSQAQPVQQKKRTQIGQPGISRTRLSSGTTVGGYGGTSAGNVNPTGLNI